MTMSEDRDDAGGSLVSRRRPRRHAAPLARAAAGQDIATKEMEMQDATIQRTGGEGGDPSAARTNCIVCFVAAVLPPAALVGVIMANANRRGDGGRVDTHRRLQIRTSWHSPLLPVPVVAAFGAGLWLRYGLAERLARENRTRTSREAWRHVSAADALEASGRAEAAANVTASAASSAASAANGAPIHGRRP